MDYPILFTFIWKHTSSYLRSLAKQIHLIFFLHGLSGNSTFLVEMLFSSSSLVHFTLISVHCFSHYPCNVRLWLMNFHPLLRLCLLSEEVKFLTRWSNVLNEWNVQHSVLSLLLRLCGTLTENRACLMYIYIYTCQIILKSQKKKREPIIILHI